VNIILVIQPKKQEEDVRLTMASILGSAKATQEADLVLLLQVGGAFALCGWCAVGVCCRLVLCLLGVILVQRQGNGEVPT
jgi:hypothetical protein